MKSIRFLSVIFCAFCLHTCLAQVTETKILPGDPENVVSFGFSVAMDGDILIVGAGESNNLGAKSGAAVVFQKVGGVWIEDSVLLASDGGEGDRFGWSVDVQGDYLFIGAYHDGANGLWAGAVYIFKYDPVNELWVQHQKLVPSDIESGHEFGCSLSVSGDYLLVGAVGDQSHIGAAYVFVNNGKEWVEEAKLIPQDYSADEPYFGVSVGLDGDYAIIGAHLDDAAANKSGAAFIFYKDGTNWIQQEKLVSNDINPNDYFGISVSISGEYAIVGAVGAIHQTYRSGAAYIFKRTGSQWTEQVKLLDPTSTIDIAFGISVSLQGNEAVVGVSEDVENGSHAGAAYVYRNNGTSWIKMAKLIASDGQESDKMGWSVDMHEGQAIAGAILHYAGDFPCGAVYIYEGFVSVMEESELLLDFKVYPIPTKDIVNCQLSPRLRSGQATVNFQYCRVELYDVYGKKVMRVHEGEISSQKIEIDVSNLTAGVYFIRVQAGEKVGVRKLIVSK